MDDKPILVGYDGSPSSRLALDWAMDEARRTGLPVVLAYAFEWMGAASWIGPGPGPGAWPDELARRDAAEVVRAAAAEAAQRDPRVSVTGLVLDGAPAAQLEQRSAESSLVVLGSRGHGGFTGLLVGSTTVAVTGHAHCPVVVVRETEPPRSRPGGVVVGVDGSESSLLALAFAVSWAAVRSLPVHVLRSWTPPSWAWAPNDLDPDEVSRLERQALDDLLTEWRTRQPDVELTATVLADHPAAALVDASRRAQLVVVGSRGRGGLRGMLLGSVSQQLLHHAEGPVAVVRELAQADAAPAAR